MLSYEGLSRNFRLLLVQVKKQLENLRALLESFDARHIKAIRGSENYIDTQKSMIENECFAFIRSRPEQDQQTLDSVRALSLITVNLERIADLAVNITRQAERLRDYETLRQFDCRSYVNSLLVGLDQVESALFQRDSALALRICRIEDDLDRLYSDDLQKIIAELQESNEVRDLVTSLFILHYLERMGDALLNIGEAIIFAVLGERLKIHQYRVLDDALAANPALERSIERVDLDSIWGTRSGVRVGRIEHTSAATESERRVLFKEGQPEKLQREREGLRRWEQVAPGLVPAVVEYQRYGQGAALLLQYLDGVTLQQVVLNADPTRAARVVDKVTETCGHVWRATRHPEAANGRYLQQLRERLDDVYRLHPSLRGREVQIGALEAPSFNRLLEQAAGLDDQLAAPFTVFIHGDFNLDNIIYNGDTDNIHFVDVYRSRDFDYVQDVSVFLVSNFRLPVFVPAVRRTLERVAQQFLMFAREFAHEQQDATFEARLALGLIRSFVTSTRFELNRRFARNMQQRAALLLRRLLDHTHGDWKSFEVPNNVLVY